MAVTYEGENQRDMVLDSQTMLDTEHQWPSSARACYYFFFSSDGWPSRLRMFTPVAVSICSVILMMASGS